MLYEKNGIACFIDLKVAFDTINHKRLLSKSDSLGFRGTINHLLESKVEGLGDSICELMKKNLHATVFELFLIELFSQLFYQLSNDSPVQLLNLSNLEKGVALEHLLKDHFHQENPIQKPVKIL